MIARSSGWALIVAGLVAFWLAVVWGARVLLGMS